MKTIGIFGGTFSPVHNGHLRMALELKQHLVLDEMRLVPAHQPPHRSEEGVSSLQRLKMVELAIDDCMELTIDSRELNRDCASYTVDTLSSLRGELGSDVSLVLCMGMDSFLSLPSWHRWEELLSLAHIAVAARPGWELPESGKMLDFFQKHVGTAADFQNAPAGKIVVETLTLLPISATAIRKQIQQGLSPMYLLPKNVWKYIQQQNLYGAE
ncbi:MAG: nicotinate-nucleotide adenylyltransferase [Cellvibrionaceae bacterium]